MAVNEHTTALIRPHGRRYALGNCANSTELQIMNPAERHHRAVWFIGSDFRPGGNHDVDRRGHPLHHQVVEYAVPYFSALIHSKFDGPTVAVMKNTVGYDNVFEVAF